MRYQTNPRCRTALQILHPFIVIGNDLWTIFSVAWLQPRLFWLHGCFFVLCTAILIVLLFTLLMSGITDGYCTPGGNFELSQKYNPWASQYIFQITMGFGQLSFTQAKLIDVVWDVVVGRGGQFVLSCITFVVFSKSLNRILERPYAAISYNTFRAIIFEKPSIISTLNLLRDLCCRTTWQTRLSMIWFILASMYVVAFPTITSAMTGYSYNVDPFFDSGDGQKVNLTDRDLSRALYQIKDADRIEGLSLSPGYVVATGPFDPVVAIGPFNPYSFFMGDPYYSCLDKYYSWPDSDYSKPEPFQYSSNQRCALGIAVSRYIDLYGLDTQNITSSFTLNATAYHVPQPTLEIEVFNVDPYTNLSIGRGRNLSSLPYMYKIFGQSALHSSSEVNSHGTCDSRATYQWGFSFLLLFSFLVATTFWIAGMYVMWSDAFWHSRLDVAGRHMGFFRGVADVSNAMWRDTLQHPGELASDAEIKLMLARRQNGGHVGCDEIDRHKLPPPRSTRFAVWRTGVASLNGWTDTWTAVHGLEWLVLLAVGMVLQFRMIISIAALCYLFAAVLLLVGIGGAFRRWWPALRRRVVSGRREMGRVAPIGTDAAIPLNANTARLEQDTGGSEGSG